jgi:hypothetical protein
MLKFVLTFGVLVLGLAACTSPTPAPAPGATPTPTPVSVIGCSAEQLVDGAAASVLASLDNCQNVALIKSDVQALWGSANLCAMVSSQKQVKGHIAFRTAKKLPPLKGIIANLACPFALSTIDNMLKQSNWAQKYNCTGSADIDAAFTAACDLLPF